MAGCVRKDGKYRASEEAAAAHEDHSQTSNRKRNRSGAEKASETSAGGEHKNVNFTMILFATLAALLILST
ncbi:hypothetical protein TNCT_402031 [Trichonephila clavata]|uniref:Uncharacterized protein n=1 Tax=Trichonephila clavata TaxID=2740835 RepID=A0A8X6L851_TRICU|nr:hypothetical protein TNCT_402031 [Trichonephila clavata]